MTEGQTFSHFVVPIIEVKPHLKNREVPSAKLGLLSLFGSCFAITKRSVLKKLYKQLNLICRQWHLNNFTLTCSVHNSAIIPLSWGR